jgi:surface antigen
MCLLTPRAAAITSTASPSLAPAAFEAGAVIPRPADAAPLVLRPAEFTTIGAGETVASMARTYNINAGTLRWANGWSDGQEPVAGTDALIPPSNGVLVEVLPGESPSQFAARLNIDPQIVLEFNHLTHDVPQPGGTFLQVPDGSVGGNVVQAANVVPVGQNIPGVSISAGPVGDAFPYGQCTYYVASKRGVTWGGDAWTWWSAARGIRPEGHAPVSGAIVVFDTGWAGHVALVQHVNPDGSYVVSEMNYYGNGGGWGRVDERTISASDPTVLGFIY